MTILEVSAVIGIVLTALQIGFSFGKSAKKIIASVLEKLGDYL